MAENTGGYVAYNPDYPAWYRQEADRLALFLNDSWTLDHIGSTAVPGLGGKPIIDLFVVTPEADLDIAYAFLMMAGYRLIVERAGADGHAVLAYTDSTRQFHVHLTAENGQDVLDVVRLRNYLRAHPGDRDLLDALKRKAATPRRQDTGTFPAVP